MKEYKFCQSCGYPFKKTKKVEELKKMEQKGNNIVPCAIKTVFFTHQGIDTAKKCKDSMSGRWRRMG